MILLAFLAPSGPALATSFDDPHFRQAAPASVCPSGPVSLRSIPLAAAISVGEPIPSPPGALLLSFREGDGPWGWLEATCGAE